MTSRQCLRMCTLLPVCGLPGMSLNENRLLMGLFVVKKRRLPETDHRLRICGPPTGDYAGSRCRDGFQSTPPAAKPLDSEPAFRNTNFLSCRCGCKCMHNRHHQQDSREVVTALH